MRVTISSEVHLIYGRGDSAVTPVGLLNLRQIAVGQAADHLFALTRQNIPLRCTNESTVPLLALCSRNSDAWHC